MFEEADHPILGDFREERSDVGVEYEVHFSAGDPDDQGIQRIVLAASRSEPIREPEEVFLVDRAQHRRRSLDDLVFESRDRERALAAVLLRNVAPPGRQRPVCSPVDLRVKVIDPAIEVLLVIRPYLAVDTWSRVAPDGEECGPQHRRVDMVEERCELLLLPLPCGLPYAFQRL
jgi:hypothetical protein